MFSVGIALWNPTPVGDSGVEPPAWVSRSDVTAATLDIDFINNRAWLSPDEVAISTLLARAGTSTKWVRNAAGTLTSFAANVLAYTDLGMVSEAAATNLFLHSQAINGTNWTALNVVATDDSIAAPDGATTAELITDANTGGAAQCHFSRSVNFGVTGSACSVSVFAKAGSVSILRITSASFDAAANGTSYFNLGTGALGTTSVNHVNPRITAHTNGWYRCSFTITPASDANGVVQFALATSEATTIASDGTKNFYLWQGQAEVGSRASTIIPTTTTSVTRAADVVTFSNLTWFNGATDSFYAEWNARNVDNAVIWAFDAANNKALDETSGMSPRLQGATVGNTASVDAVAVVGGRMQVDNFALTLSGGTLATDVSETAPGTLTASRLGCDLAGANYLGNFIRRLASFNTVLDDAALLALSDP